MEVDTRDFASACSICAQGNSSHQATAGQLWPLPVPGWPWFHILLDFVSGLPPSDGNTVVLKLLIVFLQQSILSFRVYSQLVVRFPCTDQWSSRKSQSRSGVRCVTAINPSSWISHLSWIEYAHNFLTSSATGVFPFESSL